MNLVVLLSAFVLLTTDAAQILVGYPSDTLSHLYSLGPYLEHLADAGHQITILQTAGSAPEVKFSHPNITSIFVRMTPDVDIRKIANTFIWELTSHSTEITTVMLIMNRILNQFIDEHSDALPRLLNQHWDLVVVEQYFNPMTYALATYHKRVHGTPYIQYASTHPLEADSIDNGLSRSWASKMSLAIPIPCDSLDLYRADSFKERLVGFLENSVALVLHSFSHLYTLDAIRRLGLNSFTMQKFNQDSSLYLSDMFRGFDVAAQAHDFRLVGSYCQSAKKLNANFEKFVGDEKSKGTIYLAFGSIVNWQVAPQPIVDAIFGALNELTEYRVIISSRSSPKGIQMRSHVMLTPWAPQIPLLSDSRTRMFISHGGLKSVKEAICGRTPVLYVPLFGEQSHNARQMVQLGMATLVNKYTITKTAVMQEILNNSRYQERADKFYSEYVDHPIPTLDLAVHLSNRIIWKRGQDLWFERKSRRLGWLEFTYSPLVSGLAVLFYVVNRK